MSNSYKKNKGLFAGASLPVGQERSAKKNFYVASPEVFGVKINVVFS
jgi:lipid-binding SYLF domain-containing protein